MFPRDNKGVEHCDKVNFHGRKGQSLRAYYAVVSGETVYIDIWYKLTV